MSVKKVKYLLNHRACALCRYRIDNGLAEKALNSVKEKLDTEYGIVLQQPPYSKYYLNLGKFLHILRDIKKMQAYFAITIHG